ncbi:unnamed protein product, partial [marine sediment metagenome]
TFKDAGTDRDRFILPGWAALWTLSTPKALILELRLHST